ncbi:MAG: glycosyltransferase [Patescibacteria group bacterium]
MKTLLSSKQVPKKTPKVSFVIRTKNEGRFIGKVLKFLYRQTFKDFEVIIIDSGSTDKTLVAARKFPTKIIKIKSEEFNFSYALNLGISKAKGDFIGVISGHSIPVSDSWLADGLNNFDNKKVVGVSGYYTEVPIGYFSRFLGRIFFAPYQKKKHIDSAWMTNTNALIRKKAWGLYPFDEKLPDCEDYDWASEMLARGYKIVKDPKFSVFHSHFLLRRPGWLARQPQWKKTCALIDKRKRPRKPYTKIKM